MEETIRFELNGKITEMLLDLNQTLFGCCGAHIRIIKAIKVAAKEMKGGA